MKLLELIVKKKVLVSLLVVLIVGLGSTAVWKMNKEIMPSFKMDGAYIWIDAGELAAIEVERTITTPIEQQLRGIDGIDSIDSTTSIGSASVQITIERGRGDEVFQEIEAITYPMKLDMPNVRELRAGQYGANGSYEMFLDVAGGELDKMSAYSRDILKPRLEKLKEVKEVNISGLLEKEVIIQLNREQLQANGLDVHQVLAALNEMNEEATLGELTGEQGTPLIRWNTKYTSIEQVKQTSIRTMTGFVQLKDIADVSLQPIPNNAFVWKNGTKDIVFVQISRAANSTQIEMAKAVRKELKKIENEGLVDGFTLNEMVAQADYVQQSIDGVTGNILIGGAVAIAVLLLFLRNIRATLIISISIPISVLLTMLTMWMFDYSLNLLTLIGLGLGIGMMVDASIVILESIYRQRELGLGKLEAVLRGTKEVAAAVFASVLTTIVVFLPIGFIGGDLGQFMIVLSLVVAITLIASMIVAFTLIPTLAEHFLKEQKNVSSRREGFFLKRYEALVAWTVHKKRRSALVIGIFALLFISSLFFVNRIPMSVMPDIYNRYTELLIEVEPGIDADDKESIVQQVNAQLQNIVDVQSNHIIDSGNMLAIIVNMTKGDAIQKEQKEVNEEILQAIRALEETTPITSVQSVLGGSGGKPIQLQVTGEDFHKLQTVASELKNELETIPGIVGVTHSMMRTSEEQQVVIRDEALKKAGLSSMHLKQFIEQAFVEIPLGEMTVKEKTYPIQLGFKQSTSSKDGLLELTIPTDEGEKPLSTFISLQAASTPNEILHIDGDRMIVISADMEGQDLGTVNRAVQKMLDNYKAPEGYTVSVAGDLEEQQQLFVEMLIVLAVALFLVYFVMAVQFNHFGHPLIVMATIPVAVVGVIIGLFTTQMELNLMSGMGIIMLIGIVLNNAILLIDRTNQLRREGLSIEASLVEAGKNRIRPIFMTTLTTVGGMLPLALASGASGNYQAPLATAIISGLLFATCITLLLIPSIYRLFSTSKKATK